MKYQRSMPINIKQIKIVWVLYKDIFLEHISTIFWSLAERIVRHVGPKGLFVPHGRNTITFENNSNKARVTVPVSSSFLLQWLELLNNMDRDRAGFLTYALTCLLPHLATAFWIINRSGQRYRWCTWIKLTHVSCNWHRRGCSWCR
jgi:hypothetical protein